MVGDKGRAVRKGQFGNRTCPVTGVEPPLDGGSVEGVTRGDDNRVGHYLEGNRTFKVVRELSRHYSVSLSMSLSLYRV